jgi:hypothetical protein
MEFYSAEVVLDPHQAVMLSQEARARGVRVTEFAFTATSVGRLALSLHQAIRQHRIAFPPDEDLADELASVRLRKNTLGVYRLDHDSGQHDDQAVAIALGTYWLLGDESTAEAWIAWIKRLSEEVSSENPAAGAAAPRRALRPAPALAAAAGAG